jgi:predicted transcriptional regulator
MPTADTTTVRVPRDLIEAVRQLAERHDRSLSAELRVALRAYVEVETKEQ